MDKGYTLNDILLAQTDRNDSDGFLSAEPTSPTSSMSESMNDVFDDADDGILELAGYYPTDNVTTVSYIPGRPGRKPQNEVNRIGPDEISDESLCITPVKQLNHLLKSYKCSKEQIQKLKHRRRILRNRGYTLKCRDRKLEQKNELSEECLKYKNAFDEKNQENENNLNEIKRLTKEVIGYS